MTKKTSMIILFLLTLFSVPAKAADEALSLTLDEALQKVFSASPALREADAAVDASAARVRQAQSGYYPQIGVELSYTHLWPDPAIPFPGFGTMQLFPENNYDYHAAARLRILDFGKTGTGVGIAGQGLATAKENAALVRSNLAFQTRQVFYSLLFLRQSVQVHDQEIRSLNEYMTMTENKVKSGSATEFEVLTIRVKFEEAKDRKIDDENRFRKQQILLCRLMGINETTVIEPQGEFPHETVNMDAAALTAEALAQRNEMKMAGAAEKSASLQLKAAKLGFAPTLDAQFLYGYKNGYLPELDAVLQDTVIGARLELPLFTGFRTLNQVKEARAGLTAANARVTDTKNLVTADVLQAIEDVRASTDKVAAAELHVKLADDAMSQANVRYRSGVITNLDLLNAEISQAQARLLHLQSLYDYATSVDSLKKAAGEEL